MKKLILLSLATTAVIINYNCQKSAVAPDPANVKLYLPEQPYEYSKVSTTIGKLNNYYEDMTIVDNNKATLGRVLFYDKALSLNNTVACASCHSQKNAFADVVAFSKGFEEKQTVRNSMGISNLIDERNIGYFWDARETKIESMVFAPIANHIEMGFDRLDLITEKISKMPYYAELFQKAYGTQDITEQRMRESMGQFLFSLVSQNSKFDEGMYKGFTNFTEQELRGKKLFTDNNCGSCHQISSGFSSSYGSTKFANIGLDLVDNDPGIKGLYKIPRLKNIALTAPYMHDGRFKTLEEVLEHYSHNIEKNQNLSFQLRDNNQEPKRLEFTAEQKADLIAFLNTLTDTDLISNPKYASPFIN